MTLKSPLGEHILLMAKTLRQVTPLCFYYSYRQVKRSELADFFRSHNTVMALSGNWDAAYPNTWHPEIWLVGVEDGYLHIGCQKFSRTETQTIKKWALAQKKVSK